MRHSAPRSIPTYYGTTILCFKCMGKLYLIQAHNSLHVVQLHEKVDIEQYKKRGKYYKSRKCAKHYQERFSLGCADCREVFCALCVPAASVQLFMPIMLIIIHHHFVLIAKLTAFGIGLISHISVSSLQFRMANK